MADTFFVNGISLSDAGWFNPINDAVYKGIGLTGFSTIAAATTPDIFATTVSGVINYTGTTTCTGFVAAQSAGQRRTLVCQNAAVFTAGANMLIDGVSSGNNLTCAALDKVYIIAFNTTQFLLSRTPYAGTSTPTGSLLATLNFTAQTQALTSISNGTPAVFTNTSALHLPEAGSPVQFTTSGTLPTGLSLLTTYYVNSPSGSAYNVSLTMADALAGINKVATTGAGSGTHTQNSIYVKGMAGTESFIITELQAAGGGTGGISTSINASTGGGAAGGYSRQKILAASILAAETITLGAGGTAGTTSGTNGGTGGTSSFGSHSTATGGAPSLGNTVTATTTAGGAGGTGASGDINLTGNSGSGGATGAGAGLNVGGVGGGSIFGGSGVPPASVASPGANAVKNSGSGASGACTSNTPEPGGIGGSGRCIVYVYS